jgi:hypothetical protein
MTRDVMRVSDYFNLKRKQPTLDFVDVDVFGDTKVFVDPRALRLLPSTWGDECVSLVQNFFRVVLEAIQKGEHGRARQLLGALGEPNETHLGLSKARARGRALGEESAVDVWEALSKSDAVSSGLLEDLEDTILMVDGISSDIISDITTNIIRQPLIEYTQSVASLYQIPLTPDVNSGPLWDPKAATWVSGFVSLPVTTWGKLLLVPKVIVRRRMDYDVDEYFLHYLLHELQAVELDANSELVQLLKHGGRRVTKRDLIKKYGRGKSVIVRETRRHPSVLQRYRDDKRGHYQPPLDHLDIAQAGGSPPPDWDGLLTALQGTAPGHDSFAQYEGAIEALMSALFYPSLTSPQLQRVIHEGRKRIDIVYTNTGTSGFFAWVGQHYTAPHLFVECKNYDGEPGNPELDQLSGRFSPSRGRVGILACRRFKDKDLFLQRCRDTADDQRGFIIALDDEDFAALVGERRGMLGPAKYRLLRERFEALVM